MIIADRIALKILEEIESKTGKNFTKEEYLDLECLVSDTLKQELNSWLSWDTDLNEFQE